MPPGNGKDDQDKPDLLETLADGRIGPRLVYGLETSRNYVRENAGIVNFDDSQPHPFSLKWLDRRDTERPEAETRGATTADVLNNHAFRTFRTQLQGADEATRSYSLFNPDARVQFPTPLIRLEALREHQQEASKGNTVEDQAVFRQYQEGLLASKHSPLRTVAGDTSRMAVKENMPDPQGDPKKEGEVMFRHQTAIACKYGLQFGFDNGRILFELGSSDPSAKNHFDPHRAAEKQAGDGRASQSTGVQLRSITNVELRTAFRHDPGDDRLQFFSGGQKTTAPWDGDHGKWKDYAWDRVDKYAERGVLSADQAKGLHETLKTAYETGTFSRETFREVNGAINAAKSQSGSGGSSPPQSAYPMVDAVYQRLSTIEKDHPIPGIETVAERSRAAAAIAAKMHENGMTSLGGVHHLREIDGKPVNGFVVWDQASSMDSARRFGMTVDAAVAKPMQDSLKTLDQPQLAEQTPNQSQRMMAKL